MYHAVTIAAAVVLLLFLVYVLVVDEDVTVCIGGRCRIQQGLYRLRKVLEFKSHFPGLGSPGIKPGSWRVMEV